MKKNQITIRAAAFFMTLIMVIGVAVLNNQRVAQAVEAETPAVENDLLLCNDEVDNDLNLLIDSSDPACAPFFVAPVEPPAPIVFPTPSAENELLLCYDGVDNDLDLVSDASDPDCASFYLIATSTATSTDSGEGNATSTASSTAPTAENTLEMCTDGLDNDLDILIDLSDSDCSPFASEIIASSTATSTDEGSGNATTTDSGSSNGGGGSSGSGFTSGFTSFSSGGSSSGLPTGQGVLGASTGPTVNSNGQICVPTLTSYMRMNQVNNTTDVKKLQVILNTILGTRLAINGVFGIDTENAVNQLQSSQSEAILMPWVRAGLMATPVPTGYVYKTTSWYINDRLCGGNVLPQPLLP